MRLGLIPMLSMFRQKLHSVNPRKEATIKDEVEKLIKVGFIYPVQLTEWVSNPVPVNKKQGTIHVCMDFHDLNKACPKDNFPTPFIDQIIDECAGCEFFSFMDGFSGYNQIQIKPEDQHKTAFICPWGTSLVMIPRKGLINMVMILMLHGDKTNATSKLNSISQTEVSTEREYSPSGIFSPKI
jgi:hypothetical protein